MGTTWALGAALLDRAHVRIDSLYVLFPQGLRLVLDLAALVVFVGFSRSSCGRARGRFSVVEFGIAPPIGARDADRDSAGPVGVGFAFFVVVRVVLLIRALGMGVAGYLHVWRACLARARPRKRSRRKSAT